MTFRATFREDGPMDATFGSTTVIERGGIPPGGTEGQYLVKNSNLDGDAGWKDLPVYDGVYEITPMVDAQTVMQTQQRYLDRNVVVKEVPYQEVGNLSGGKTVTIGG